MTDDPGLIVSKHSYDPKHQVPKREKGEKVDDWYKRVATHAGYSVDNTQIRVFESEEHARMTHYQERQEVIAEVVEELDPMNREIPLDPNELEEAYRLLLKKNEYLQKENDQLTIGKIQEEKAEIIEKLDPHGNHGYDSLDIAELKRLDELAGRMKERKSVGIDTPIPNPKATSGEVYQWNPATGRNEWCKQ